VAVKMGQLIANNMRMGQLHLGSYAPTWIKFLHHRLIVVMQSLPLYQSCGSKW